MHLYCPMRYRTKEASTRAARSKAFLSIAIAMRSSFTRNAPAVADSGTRSGLHGQTLISLGLVDLDRLLGGGLPLGSLLLVIEVM